MRHLLLLFVALATPVTLYGQEREYTEVPIMAAAVKYMQRFHGEGLPPYAPTPPEHQRKNLRLDVATYVIEPIRTRVIDGRELGIQRLPRKSPAQDPMLLGQLSATVGLDTIALERAERECVPYDAPRKDGLTDRYTACRFRQIDGVLGVSLPVITGDTAKVEVWSWVNLRRSNAPETVDEEVWEVTLVRQAGAWRAVSHKFANAWRA